MHTTDPVNTAPPSIFGDPVVAEQLRVLPGAWTSPDGDKITINYYWDRCDASGTNCDYLHTGRTHTFDTRDIGHVMKVLMSVETDHGVTSVWLQTPPIGTADPVNTSPPSITGSTTRAQSSP